MENPLGATNATIPWLAPLSICRNTWHAIEFSCGKSPATRVFLVLSGFLVQGRWKRSKMHWSKVFHEGNSPTCSGKQRLGETKIITDHWSLHQQHQGEPRIAASGAPCLNTRSFCFAVAVLKEQWATLGPRTYCRRPWGSQACSMLRRFSSGAFCNVKIQLSTTPRHTTPCGEAP